MTDSNRPHDALFKQVFTSTEHAASILEKILPQALARKIDWTSLQLCSGSHVDALLTDSHADLLFSAHFVDEPALLYLLFEHQSSPDELMPLRLLRYVVRIIEWHTKQAASRGEPVLPLPLVVPVVLPSAFTLPWSAGAGSWPDSTPARAAEMRWSRSSAIFSWSPTCRPTPSSRSGRAEGRASAIVRILEARQKVLTSEQRAIIEGCHDIAQLDAWLVKATVLVDTRELFE